MKRRRKLRGKKRMPERNLSYLFIQMSSRVVYKWKHEQVINHKKARKCSLGEKGMEMMKKGGAPRWSRGILCLSLCTLRDKIIGGEAQFEQQIRDSSFDFYFSFLSCFMLRIFVQWSRTSESFFPLPLSSIFYFVIVRYFPSESFYVKPVSINHTP